MKKKQKIISGSTGKKTQKIFNALKLLLAIVLLDQLSKHYILQFFPIGSSFNVIKNFFYITHATNTGVSFGMFKGFNMLFVVVSVLALLFFIRLFNNNKKYWLQITLICAGIIGNLIDRLTLGYVVDFIDFKFFPIFNLADSAISIGVIWLIIITMKNSEDLV